MNRRIAIHTYDHGKPEEVAVIGLLLRFLLNISKQNSRKLYVSHI